MICSAGVILTRLFLKFIGMKKILFSIVASVCVLSANAQPYVRDNFFGLVMGEPASQSDVEEALSDYAVFIENLPEGDGDAYRFGNMELDGFEWGLCTVATNADGVFYYFSVECNWLEDDDAGEYEASSMFEILSAMYDERYGEGEYLAENSDEYKAYYGSNGVALVLSNYLSVSYGGEARRYLSVAFVMTGLA